MGKANNINPFGGTRKMILGKNGVAYDSNTGRVFSGTPKAANGLSIANSINPFDLTGDSTADYFDNRRPKTELTIPKMSFSKTPWNAEANIGFENNSPYGINNIDTSFGQPYVEKNPALIGRNKANESVTTGNPANGSVTAGKAASEAIASDEERYAFDPNMFQSMFMGTGLDTQARIFGHTFGGLTQGDLGVENWVGAVGSGVALGTGLARNIMGGISSQRMNKQMLEAKKKREAEARVDNYEPAPLIGRDGGRFYKKIYAAADGGVFNGYSKTVNPSDLTGEHVYPIPKAMESQENIIEVEKGEYVQEPDGSVYLAEGEKHGKGGTKITLGEGETRVVSKRRKIGKDEAAKVSDKYGVKVSEGTPYATVIDKYKKHIGLDKMYDEKEYYLKKLEKNDKIDDENTKRLNSSYISKRLTEIEPDLSRKEDLLGMFFNDVFTRQESEKDVENEKEVFGEGGMASNRHFRKSVKEYGIDADYGRRLILNKLKERKQKYQFADGGSRFRFRFQDNKLRPVTPYDPGSQSSTGNSVYGGVSVDEANSEFSRLFQINDQNDWRSFYNVSGDNYAGNVQDAINSYYDSAKSISGRISNYEDLRGDLTTEGFWGGDATSKGITDPESYYNSGSRDEKLGRFTASRRGLVGDVVSTEELRRLNDAGISTYRDLYGNEKKAREILGDATYNDINSLRNEEGAKNLNFTIGAYDPIEVDTLDPASIPVTGAVRPDLPNADALRAIGANKDTPMYNPRSADEIEKEYIAAGENPAVVAKETKGTKDAKGKTKRSSYVNGPILPPSFRLAPSPVINPAMQRHDFMRIEPVVASKEAFMEEVQRGVSSAMDQLDGVPDSQRSAIIASMSSAANSDYAKYASSVDQFNQQALNQARIYNSQAYQANNEANIAERKEYETKTLTGMDIYENNLSTYLDRIQGDMNAKANVINTYGTLSSMFPDLKMSPDGRISYDSNGKILYANPSITPEAIASTVSERTKIKGTATRNNPSNAQTRGRS